MKATFKKINEFFKKEAKHVIYALLLFGIFCSISGSFLGSGFWAELVTTLGITSIVSGFAFWIMSLSGRKLEKKLEEGLVKLNEKLASHIITTCNNHIAPILGDIKKCGIVRVFESRRDDSAEFLDQLICEFREMPENSTITIMAISFRDFILGDARKKFIPEIIQLIINKNITVKLLLLDPMSQSAKDRATVEEPRAIREGGYITSTLFKDLMSVIEVLMHPSDAIVSNLDVNKLSTKIKVRFYPYDPTTFIINTKNHTFVEQYHRGGDNSLRQTLEEVDGVQYVECFAGFTPVLMINNNARFSKLLMSHVNNIWNSEPVTQRKLTPSNYKKFCAFQTKLESYQESFKDNIELSEELFRGELGYFLNRRCERVPNLNGKPDRRRVTIH